MPARLALSDAVDDQPATGKKQKVVKRGRSLSAHSAVVTALPKRRAVTKRAAAEPQAFDAPHNNRRRIIEHNEESESPPVLSKKRKSDEKASPLKFGRVPQATLLSPIGRVLTSTPLKTSRPPSPMKSCQKAPSASASPTKRLGATTPRARRLGTRANSRLLPERNAKVFANFAILRAIVSPVAVKKSKKLFRPAVAEPEEEPSKPWLPAPDRTSERWDGTLESLKLLRALVRAEGKTFDDYYAKHEKEVARLLLTRDNETIKMFAGQPKKFFYFNEMQQFDRSDITHPAHDSDMRPRTLTVEHVKMLLRFSEVGALCERCANPFRFDDHVLRKLKCNCRHPTRSRFTIKPRAPENIPIGESELQCAMEEWDAIMAKECKRHQRELAAHLIKAMGKGPFEAAYPKYKIALCNRTDPFGRAVFKKEAQLNALRRKTLRPPTFFFAWTGQEKGELDMPAVWMNDGEMRLSEETKALYGRKKRDEYIHCTSDCASTAHHNCANRTTSGWQMTRDGRLQMKCGLMPCGTDGGDNIRMPHEMIDVEMGVCSSACKCDKDTCPSRFLERGNAKMNILFNTPHKGWSLRTAEEVVRGEYLLSFAGVISTKREVDKTKQNMDMVHDLVIHNHKATEDETLMIATCKEGNEFRHINHSCNPNGLLCVIYSAEHSRYLHRLALFARRHIAAYEEMHYDYYLADQRFRFDCQCGGYGCRGIKGLIE